MHPVLGYFSATRLLRRCYVLPLQPALCLCTDLAAVQVLRLL